MSSVYKSKTIFLVALIISLLSFPMLFMSSNMFNQKSIASSLTVDDNNNTAALLPEVKEYRADIHWVKTNIKLNRFGVGKVTMLVNCTPDANHVGLVLGNFVDNEITEIVIAETYAKTAGQTISLNITASGSSAYDFILYLSDPSHVQTNETIQYQLTYFGEFVLTGQIERSQVDANVAILNLKRPLWNITLDYQEFTIILPVDIGDSVVTPAILGDIKFNVTEQMSTYYDLSYANDSSSGVNLFIFNCSKENMGIKAPFEVTFYLSLAYFSLPNIMNWLVLLFVFVFVAGALVLSIVVINVRNKADTEVSSFKEDLQELLKPVEK
ncbi:MAG: hypothetical protein GNW80_12375 [Asgard group archaeon]|nr:hypothetical protein [Asgard group archaeon]